MDTNHLAVDGFAPVSSTGPNSEFADPLPKDGVSPSVSSSRSVSDRVELSAQGKAWAPHRPKESMDEPGSQGPWERNRLSRLDQMELLVQKGRYNVTPYMVDEIALRLARSMILA